jgi:predicted RNA-binding Zn-ribbon protein involved in translation (DUF1610 family)
MADNLSMLADAADSQPPMPNCVCQQADNEDMVGCDGCQAWYHFTCVGLRKAPKSKLYFCPVCKEKMIKCAGCREELILSPENFKKFNKLQFYCEICEGRLNSPKLPKNFQCPDCTEYFGDNLQLSNHFMNSSSCKLYEQSKYDMSYARYNPVPLITYFSEAHTILCELCAAIVPKQDIYTHKEKFHSIIE